MKDQMLKLAGVKSEAQFYNLFPDEASFIAKYGKKLRKLQIGGQLGSAIKAVNKYTTTQDANFGELYHH